MILEPTLQVIDETLACYAAPTRPFAFFFVSSLLYTLQLDSTKNNHQYAKSSFAASTGYIYNNFQYITEDIMELSFIIEWGQPLRLEVYTLADDHPAENTGIRTFEAGTDMRGDFVGNVHGTFNSAEMTFDGSTDPGFVDYRGYYQGEVFPEATLAENTTLWEGYVIPSDDLRDEIQGFSLGLEDLSIDPEYVSENQSRAFVAK